MKIRLFPLFFIALLPSIVFSQAGAGWQNLFNGKDLTGWKVLGGTATFSIEKGCIVGHTVVNSGNTFLVTEKEYGDFVLELDILIEDTAGNSGVQTRSHFDPTASKGAGKVYGRQCEADPSPRRWTGGIYDEGRREWLYPMQLNARAQNSYKPGQYNHFKIECLSNEMRTWVNGVATAYVVDTLDATGFIGLQVHAISKAGSAGKKVFFKNIRLQAHPIKPTPFPKDIYVANFVPNSLTAYEKEDGWRLLFDGKTGEGWQSARSGLLPGQDWDIGNGTISVLSSAGKEGGNTGDIVTKEEYSAFDLSFEFKLTPGANSGLKYFVTLAEKTTGSAIGLEYQVLDDSLHPDAKLGRNGNRTLASLYDLIPAAKQPRFIRPIGQWNFGRVIVYPDNKVEHYLNGIKVLEYVRGSNAFKELVAISKFEKMANFGQAGKGHILLQDHGDAVSFRSLKIKQLQ